AALVAWRAYAAGATGKYIDAHLAKFVPECFCQHQIEGFGCAIGCQVRRALGTGQRGHEDDAAAGPSGHLGPELMREDHGTGAVHVDDAQKVGKWLGKERTDEGKRGIVD